MRRNERRDRLLVQYAGFIIFGEELVSDLDLLDGDIAMGRMHGRAGSEAQRAVGIANQEACSADEAVNVLDKGLLLRSETRFGADAISAIPNAMKVRVPLSEKSFRQPSWQCSCQRLVERDNRRLVRR